MITYERVRSFTVSMNLATYPPPKWLNHHGAHVGCSHFVHLCRVRRPGFCDTFALGTKPACTLFQQIQNTSIFRNQIQFSVFTRWYHGCSIIFPWHWRIPQLRRFAASPLRLPASSDTRASMSTFTTWSRCYITAKDVGLQKNVVDIHVLYIYVCMYVCR